MGCQKILQNLHITHLGHGEPLILLHGFGWHSGIWKTFVSRLTPYFEVYLIDLPGFGKSPTIDPYLLPTLVSNLCAHLPDNAIWVGWSLGGMISWWGALHYPNKIKKLVTIASSPRFIAENNWPGVSLETLQIFAKNLKNDYRKTLSEFLNLQSRGYVHKAQLLELLQHEINQAPPPDPQALDGSLKILAELDLRPLLSQVPCKSLHIFGSLDVLVPVKVSELIKENMLHGRSEILKRAGHVPFVIPEMAAQIATWIRDL